MTQNDKNCWPFISWINYSCIVSLEKSYIAMRYQSEDQTSSFAWDRIYLGSAPYPCLKRKTEEFRAQTSNMMVLMANLWCQPLRISMSWLNFHLIAVFKIIVWTLITNQGRIQDSVQGGKFYFRAKREKFFKFAPPPLKGGKTSSGGDKKNF